MARGPQKARNELDLSIEVLGRMVAHPALPACATRADLELIARMPVPDRLWDKIETWGAENSCTCGEAVWRRHDELYREHMMAKVTPMLDAIFFDEAGNKRPDADQRLTLAADLANAKNPMAAARWNAAIAPWLNSLPADAKGSVLEDSVQAFLAGLACARVSRAHAALADARACAGMPR